MIAVCLLSAYKGLKPELPDEILHRTPGLLSAYKGLKQPLVVENDKLSVLFIKCL